MYKLLSSNTALLKMADVANFDEQEVSNIISFKKELILRDYYINKNGFK